MCNLCHESLHSKNSDAKIIIFLNKMPFSYISPTKRIFLHKNR